MTSAFVMSGVFLLEALLYCVTQCGVLAMSPENVTCHLTNKHNHHQSFCTFLPLLILFIFCILLPWNLNKAEISTAVHFQSRRSQKLGIIPTGCNFCKRFSVIFICLSVTRIIPVYEATGFELEKKASVTPSKCWVHSHSTELMN